MAGMLGLFSIGIFLLIKGGDFFVSASVQLARRTGLPRMVIGGTLVSFATTTPELVVTATASLQGNPHLAVGNAVGSVIANIGLVVGLTAAIKAVPVKAGEFQFPARMMVATACLLGFLILDYNLPRWAGLLLITSGLVYLFLDIRRMWKTEKKNSQLASEPRFLGERAKAFTGEPWARTVTFFVVGAAMVVGGSRFLVTSSEAIALYLGLPSLFVGLTIVAVGTSLPELATAIIALRRGVVDLSLGNIIGANILGLTVITGTAATINPFRMSGAADVYSLFPMLFFIVIFMVFGLTQSRFSRKEGLLLLFAYLLYVTLAYLAGTVSF